MGTIDRKMYSIREKPWLLALVCTVFMIYPTAAWQFCAHAYGHEPMTAVNELYFLVRAVVYWLFFWILLNYNLRTQTPSFLKRFSYSFLISLAGFVVYSLMGSIVKMAWIPVSVTTFQFSASCLICVFIGFIFFLFQNQFNKEKELEQMQIENLESQLNALTNQINPHFFFNSLNGISSLVRKDEKETALLYINKLSDIFRYILQSERVGLVTLREELDFVDAYRHVLEVRFANKLDFKLDVDERLLEKHLPVLSLLPLIENVSVHNMIDSEHHMTIHIFTNDKEELVVENRVMPKANPAKTNGTGLANLMNRYKLLCGKMIRVEDMGDTFSVRLPLKN